MPGIERIEMHDDARWTAHVRLPLGFLRPRLALDCAVEDRREPEFARLVARGESAKAGALEMATSFELAAGGEGTEMRWRAEVTLSGRLSAVGEKMLRPLVDRQVAKVMASLQDQVRAAA
jgi:2-furoyl-CoA dehydrogenase large subunit